MNIEKEKQLRELINKFLTEYTGTGASGGNAGDGNSITSPRPYPDEKTEMQKAYMDKSVGYGGDGGHYTNEPAFNNFNRKKMVKFEQLRKVIRTYLEQVGFDGADAYGDATNLTKGLNVAKSRFTKTGRPPGIWEDFDRQIAAINKDTNKNNLKNLDNTLKVSKLNLNKMSAQNQQAASGTEKAVQNASAKKAQEYDEYEEKKQTLIAGKAELSRLERISNPSEEELATLEALKEKLVALAQEVQQEKQQFDQALDAEEQAKDADQKSDVALGKSSAASKKAHQQLVKQTNKQKSALKEMKEKLYQEYINSRKNHNLMEYMDAYKNKALREGVVRKIWKKYDEGLTNEEIMQYYAKEGIQVPEQFLGKIKKQYENFQKMKLEIELADKESKEFKRVPLTDEELGYEEEPKQLASGLIGENEIVARYSIPPEIEDALKNTLKMKPLIRFVENLKAVNSIPPSYRVFLLNGQYFDIIYESFSLAVEIGSKKYFLGNTDEVNYAIKHINKLMTGPLKKKKDDEDEGALDDLLGDLPKPKGKKGGGSKPPSPPPPPPAPTPEPTPPPAGGGPEDEA